MNRITAFTDVEFDEHAAVRRRCQRGFKPVQRLPISVEEQAYCLDGHCYDEDGMDLAENVRRIATKPMPLWWHHVCIWGTVAGLLGVVGWALVKKWMD